MGVRGHLLEALHPNTSPYNYKHLKTIVEAYVEEKMDKTRGQVITVKTPKLVRELGLPANTAIYSLIKYILCRELGFKHIKRGVYRKAKTNFN